MFDVKLNSKHDCIVIVWMYLELQSVRSTVLLSGVFIQHGPKISRHHMGGTKRGRCHLIGM